MRSPDKLPLLRTACSPGREPESSTHPCSRSIPSRFSSDRSSVKRFSRWRLVSSKTASSVPCKLIIEQANLWLRICSPVSPVAVNYHACYEKAGCLQVPFVHDIIDGKKLTVVLLFVAFRNVTTSQDEKRWMVLIEISLVCCCRGLFCCHRRDCHPPIMSIPTPYVAGNHF